MNTPSPAYPEGRLPARAAVSVAVGMMVGAGLFRSPAVVAANVGSDAALFLVWVFGGVLGVVGALCYAELASTYPSRGGDYFFLRRAYGRWAGFLFAWARFAVINTGSIALLGYVLGDYLQTAFPLGDFGSAYYAAAAIVVLTLINIRGRASSLDTQYGMTTLLVAGVIGVGLVGVYIAVRGVLPVAPEPLLVGSAGNFGVAMVFVMLAYGGWTEVATLSAEMHDQRRGMLRALVASMVIVTALYLLINWALWRGLGLTGLATSVAPAADLLRVAFGSFASLPIVINVAAAVINSNNSTIIVCARTTIAAAQDWPGLQSLGQWDLARGVPPVAIVAQSIVALILVGLGAWTREGFATLVDYTAPVFWFFVAMSGVAVIVLRQRDSEIDRPYRLPLYPWLPLVFIGSSLFVLWSSLAYVKAGAVAGLVVMALGGLFGLILKSLGRGS
jgi:APA family basic amino acid/polyamine antiporter